MRKQVIRDSSRISKDRVLRHLFLPDELDAAIAKIAASQSKTPNQWIRERLEECVAQETKNK